MTYSVIPFFLIIVSLGTIIFIVIRKFPQATLLDVDSLPEVKTEKKKDAVLKKRVHEKAVDARRNRLAKFQPVKEKAANVQRAFRRYMKKVEGAISEEKIKEVEKEPVPLEPKKQDNLRSLRYEAQDAVSANDLESAEKKYIAAIRIDPRNKEAYAGLADVYMLQGQIQEAEETYRFLLQLDPNNDEVMLKLGDLAYDSGDKIAAVEYYQQSILINDNFSSRFGRLADMLLELDEHQVALESIQQALDIEPQNPKYLDTFIEISIMMGDKSQAEDGLNRLRMVNPENQKLPSFQARIDEI